MESHPDGVPVQRLASLVPPALRKATVLTADWTGRQRFASLKGGMENLSEAGMFF